MINESKILQQVGIMKMYAERLAHAATELTSSLTEVSTSVPRKGLDKKAKGEILHKRLKKAL